jgi:hypothetical protein
MGQDLLQYLVAFTDVFPPQTLTRGILALVNAELLLYTNALVRATNQLVRTGSLPPSMDSSSNVSDLPVTFVDFTRERGSESDVIARASVDQHIEEIRLFAGNALLLLTIDRFARSSPNLGQKLNQIASTPQYLEALVGLRQDPSVEARAGSEIELIREETVSAAEENMHDAVHEFFSAQMSALGISSLDVAVGLLRGNLERVAIDAYLKWFQSVGGLRKSYGLLAGPLRGRRAWRYVMSDDLLVVFVQLALIQFDPMDIQSIRLAPRISLRDFLTFLEERFGILVDRPPHFMDSTATRAAAQNNLEALKRRLRQMGLFEALSDDFTAQYITAPKGWMRQT